MWRRGWSDPDIAVELAISEPVVECLACIGGRGRDDVDFGDALLCGVAVVVGLCSLART